MPCPRCTPRRAPKQLACCAVGLLVVLAALSSQITPRVRTALWCPGNDFEGDEPRPVELPLPDENGPVSFSKPLQPNSAVPKVIIQTGESSLDTLPTHLVWARKTLMRSNPSYEMLYFDAAQQRTEFSRLCPEQLDAFDAVIPGAFRSDLFRYCYLLHHGGIYVDIGMWTGTNATADFDLSIGSGWCSAVGEHCGELRAAPMPHVVVAEDNGFGDVANGFIAAVAEHQLLRLALSMASDRIRSRYYEYSNSRSSLALSGPTLFRDAAQKYLLSEFNITVERFVPFQVIADLRIASFTRHEDCRSGVLMISPRTMLLFSKVPGYIAMYETAFKSVHYGMAWRNGPRHVFRELSRQG